MSTILLGILPDFRCTVINYTSNRLEVDPFIVYRPLRTTKLKNMGCIN